MKKETLDMIKTLEERTNTVKVKLIFNKKKIRREKRELKRGKKLTFRKKKFELNILELKNNLEASTDSKNELQTRLDNENNKLFKLKRQFRDIRKNGQTNPFNFYNTLKDDEIDLGKIINIAENNITLHENEPIFNVITGAGKDKYPFILRSLFFSERW